MFRCFFSSRKINKFIFRRISTNCDNPFPGSTYFSNSIIRISSCPTRHIIISKRCPSPIYPSMNFSFISHYKQSDIITVTNHIKKCFYISIRLIIQRISLCININKPNSPIRIYIFQCIRDFIFLRRIYIVR